MGPDRQLRGRKTPAVTILLDPSPELREDSLGILAFAALKRVGYEEYREPGIPPRDVRLLSPGTIGEETAMCQRSAGRISAQGRQTHGRRAKAYLVNQVRSARETPTSQNSQVTASAHCLRSRDRGGKRRAGNLEPFCDTLSSLP